VVVRVTFLVIAGLLLGIALVTFLATRIARLVAYLRRPRRR
jgi:hypothetical protein